MHDDLFEPGALRVKICGITNPDDAWMAVEAGTDAVGINVFPGSKRFVELDAAAIDWIARLPVTRVAVVVNAPRAEIARIVDAGCFDAVQFHGDETPEQCAASPLPWIRAIRVSGVTALLVGRGYGTPHLLLDGHSASSYGGTGVTVDPAMAAAFVRENPDRRVMLAGGLSPENVVAAVRAVRPAAVDVASGVECTDDPRRKDRAKVRAFIYVATRA